MPSGLVASDSREGAAWSVDPVRRTRASVEIKCINYFRFTLGQDDTHVQEEIEEDTNFGRHEKHREMRRVEERGRDRMVMMGPKYLTQEDGKAKHGTRDRWSATEGEPTTQPTSE